MVSPGNIPVPSVSLEEQNKWTGNGQTVSAVGSFAEKKAYKEKWLGQGLTQHPSRRKTEEGELQCRDGISKSNASWDQFFVRDFHTSDHI